MIALALLATSVKAQVRDAFDGVCCVSDLSSDPLLHDTVVIDTVNNRNDVNRQLNSLLFCIANLV